VDVCRAGEVGCALKPVDTNNLGHRIELACEEGLEAIDFNDGKILGTVSLVHDGWAPQRETYLLVYLR
jgi:hypothetical protein